MLFPFEFRKSRTFLFVIILGFISLVPAVFASEGVALKNFQIDREPETLREGYKIVSNICLRCHNLDYISYRNLMEIGFTQDEVDQMRGNSGLDQNLTASMPVDVMKVVFGAVPPDLSLMAKARKGGPQYIYTLMTSYYEKESAVSGNKLFPGIRMPDIFDYSLLQGDEKKLVEDKVAQVAVFLEWAADPRANERKQLGIYVLIYFVLISVLFYMIKNKIWSRLD